MDKESLSGAIKVHMTVTFTRTIFMEMVNMFGPMAESTMDNGLIIKWKDLGLSPGAMAGDMWVNIKMIKNMDKELSNGLMAENTSANGVKENNTVKEHTLKKAKRDMVFGKWAKE